ncbi:hypothetical protein [Bosea sp. BK604]|uniref:hypothetical protein n=1 Tax=Bosea sp. BK604 TaxID=2512180 RepID=UPI0010502BA2|nr:hypothetical protein [Bosea sp. BK604]TCR64181.1 hypothetical protein EV560_107269 [Bosea sp. BK604]
MSNTPPGSPNSGPGGSGSGPNSNSGNNTPANPYFRVLQPQTPTSAFTASSYLRLGNYVADETGLPTGLTTSTSTVGVDSSKGGAKEQAEAAELNEKNDPAKQYTATSQSSTAYKTTPTAVAATDHAGILIYSDGELNENIAGAALQKFGKGHVVEVTTADAKYGVVEGKLDISASNGIFVKAGLVDTNTGSVSRAANLELTASGYIKQTAYGPLDEITYGTTRKNFHGDAYDEFHGFKESIFHGREHTYKMSGVMQLTLSGELIIKLSTQFALTAGIDTGIRLALDIKMFIGGKFDIVVLEDAKIVLGFSEKLVVGSDWKMAGSDMKILSTVDMKFAPVADMKKVGFNVTICDFDFKKQFIKAESSEAEALKKAFEAGIKDLKAEGGMTEAKVKQLTAMF